MMNNSDSYVSDCVKAFSVYNKLFGKLFIFIFKWDEKERKLKKNSRNKFYISLFNILVGVLVVGCGSSSYVIIKSLLYPDLLPLRKALVAVVYLFISLFISTNFVGLLFKLDECIDSGNAILQMSSTLYKSYSSDCRRCHDRYFRSDAFWIFLKWWAYIANVVLFLVIVLLTPASTTLKRSAATPFAIVFNDILPKTICNPGNTECIQFREFFIGSLRVVMSIISFSQGCGFLAFLFTFGIIYLSCIFTSIKMMYVSLSSDKNVTRFSIRYKAFQIVVQVFNNFGGTLISISMAFGFYLVVFCTVASVKTVGTLPLRIYWFLPMVDWIVITVIHFALPLAAEVYVKTELILKKLHWNVVESRNSSFEFKLGRMVERSLKPMQFKCWNFYGIKVSTKTRYYSSILDTTIDTLLTM
ncbi:unnamed protein product [Orchesella dallaii]|uniref:Gustatory receptor n=1 Tax=Orchesella dallaii TaxID=48710 RepID=A0ABP1PLC7_9HEXA